MVDRENLEFLVKFTYVHKGCLALEVHYLKKWYFFCNFDGLLQASLTKNPIKPLNF